MLVSTIFSIGITKCMFYNIVEETIYNHAGTKSFCNDNKTVMLEILYS